MEIPVSIFSKKVTGLQKKTKPKETERLQKINTKYVTKTNKKKTILGFLLETAIKN